jgi:hypothetical protein
MVARRSATADGSVSRARCVKSSDSQRSAAGGRAPASCLSSPSTRSAAVGSLTRSPNRSPLTRCPRSNGVAAERSVWLRERPATWRDAARHAAASPDWHGLDDLLQPLAGRPGRQHIYVDHGPPDRFGLPRALAACRAGDALVVPSATGALARCRPRGGLPMSSPTGPSDRASTFPGPELHRPAGWPRGARGGWPGRERAAPTWCVAGWARSVAVDVSECSRLVGA